MEDLGRELVDSAVCVHRALGPGLLESAYEVCLVRELELRRIEVARQVPLPIRYRDVELDAGYRLDLVLGGKVVVELKAVEKLLPIHKAQLLSYLRLSRCRLGFLLNFNVRQMKEGITRMLNGY